MFRRCPGERGNQASSREQAWNQPAGCLAGLCLDGLGAGA